MQNFVDATSIWLKNAKPNSHQIKDAKYFKKDGIKYYVDGKNVILDYSQKEKEVALWLENTFGGKIFMLPKINKPDSIRTADYLWRNKYWDLKIINGNSNKTMDNSIKNKKEQAHNFIIDITNSLMQNNEAISYIQKIYNDKQREWIKNIILKRKEKIVYIFKRK